jgi:hypothetical protein
MTTLRRIISGGAHWNPLMWGFPIALCVVVSFLIWTLSWLVPYLLMMWQFNEGMPWVNHGRPWL